LVKYFATFFENSPLGTNQLQLVGYQADCEADCQADCQADCEAAYIAAYLLFCT